MLMDIDKELDEIIYKYDIDYCYPRYRQMKRAEELLRDFVNGLDEGDKVAFIATALGEGKEESVWRIRKILLKCGKSADFFVCYKNEQCEKYDEVYHFDELYRLKEKEYSKIALISYSGEEFVCHWLAENMPETSYLSMYDYFASNGLVLDHEYYEYMPEDPLRPIEASVRVNTDDPFGYGYHMIDTIVFEFVNQRNKLKQTIDDDVKQLLVKRLFCLSLIMRDFSEAEKYFGKIGQSQGDNRWEKAWADIGELLQKIKSSMDKRNTHDILLLWIDDVSYERSKEMPFLWELTKRGIVFDNMISPIPETRPALNALLCAKRAIHSSYRVSDIGSDNSPVFRLLEDKQYRFRAVCGHGVWDKLDESHGSDRFYRQNSPASAHIWEALRQVLLGERPAFVMTHIFDTHPPYSTVNIKSNDLRTGQNEGYTSSNYYAARKKADELLHFYSEYFGNTTYILMSDHGNEVTWPKQHVFFAICGKNGGVEGI